jgi:hypothetical protein
MAYMPDQEVKRKIQSGDKLASRDPMMDLEWLHEVFALPDPMARLHRLEELIEASRESDGWASSLLTGAKPYIENGVLPDNYFE